jgi:hypothetical protein
VGCLWWGTAVAVMLLGPWDATKALLAFLHGHHTAVTWHFCMCTQGRGRVSS